MGSIPAAVDYFYFFVRSDALCPTGARLNAIDKRLGREHSAENVAVTVRVRLLGVVGAWSYQLLGNARFSSQQLP